MVEDLRTIPISDDLLTEIDDTVAKLQTAVHFASKSQWSQAHQYALSAAEIAESTCAIFVDWVQLESDSSFRNLFQQGHARNAVLSRRTRFCHLRSPLCPRLLSACDRIVARVLAPVRIIAQLDCLIFSYTLFSRRNKA